MSDYLDAIRKDKAMKELKLENKTKRKSLKQTIDEAIELLKEIHCDGKLDGCDAEGKFTLIVNINKYRHSTVKLICSYCGQLQTRLKRDFKLPNESEQIKKGEL